MYTRHGTQSSSFKLNSNHLVSTDFIGTKSELEWFVASACKKFYQVKSSLK